MQIEHLRCFQTVANCGSMNKAAKALFVTQPAISSAIKSLEDELGIPLFERTSTGIQLTEFGAIVLQDTNLMIGYVDKWKQLAEKKLNSQDIKIFLTGTSPSYQLINCINTLREIIPEINIKLEYSPSRKGHIIFSSDTNFRFGISYRVPAHISETKKFTSEHGMRIAILQRDEFGLVVNPKSELAQLQRDIVVDDLRGKEILLYQDPKNFPYFDRLRELKCKIGPQMWWEEMMMIAVSTQVNSISLRPTKAVEHNAYVDAKQTVVRNIVDYQMPVYLCLLYPSNERMTPAEVAFLREFKKMFPEFEALN